MNVNSDSGMLNTVSGKEGSVQVERNERSHWSNAEIEDWLGRRSAGMLLQVTGMRYRGTISGTASARVNVMGLMVQQSAKVVKLERQFRPCLPFTVTGLYGTFDQ